MGRGGGEEIECKLGAWPDGGSGEGSAHGRGVDDGREGWGGEGGAEGLLLEGDDREELDKVVLKLGRGGGRRLVQRED